MIQSLSFVIVNATAIGVSLISDLMEKVGWSSGKTLKVWLCGWQRNIVFSNIESNQEVVVAPDMKKWDKKRRTIKKWLR